MKKILLAAVAALAIVGCSQNEEIEKAGEKAEINFTTVVKGSTKALITTTENFSTFTVCGYKTSGDMSTETQLVAGFMDNEEFTGGPDWTHSTTFYWPISGSVQFFATSPQQSLTLPKGYPAFTYSINDDIKLQEDLVAASVTNKNKESGDIVLPFKHLLTQVNFTIKGNTPDFTYKVSKIILKGVKKTGTFKFSDGTTSVGEWTLDAATADYTYTPDSPVTVVTATDGTGEKSFETSGNALFMLMPQDLSGGNIALDITYTAAPTNKVTEYTFNDTKTVTLKGAWNQATNIRYTLELTSDATPIKFGTPSVGGWTDETGTTEPATPTTPDA